MARPNKQGLDYFPLNTDISKDDKIALIEAKHGLMGFGVIIKLYEKIYCNKGYYYEWNEDIQLLFAKQVGLEIKKLEEIINDAIKWGLFDEKLFKKYKILTSRRIQKTFLEATKRRKEIPMIQKYLLSGVNGYINEVNNNIILINDDISTQTEIETEIETEINIAPSNETLHEANMPKTPTLKDKKQKDEITFNFDIEKWEGLKKEHFQNWLEAYPLIDIDQELIKAKEWILSNLSKSKHKHKWRQFLNNWFKKAQENAERKAIYARNAGVAGTYRK